MKSSLGQGKRRAATGLRKYLDGWEAGALAVFVAWAVAIVVVPRTVEPGDVPLPRVAGSDLAALRERWDREAARAEVLDLDPSVRLLGARVRRYGREERAGVIGRIEGARREVAAAAAPALRDHPEQVHALAAHHARLLAAAVHAWARDGVESDDLVELGGDAAAVFQANGWLPTPGAASPDFDLVVRGLYRRRFAALVGAEDLAVDRIETVVVNRFLMAHAEGSDSSASPGPALLRRIDEVAGVDPNYPASYARGIVLYRMGRFEAAASSFDAFLSRGETGPYRLRAANYLKVSVEQSAP